MRRWYWIAVLLPALLAGVIWQRGGIIDLDIGIPNDQVVLTGFHDRESSAVEQATYRWTTADATVAFAAHRLPALLHLRGRVAPDGTQVTLVLNGDARIALPALTQPEPSRRYLIYWNGSPSAFGRSELRIAAKLPAQQLEIRPLGLLLDRVAIASIRQGLAAPPWLLLAAFTLITILLASAMLLFQIREAYSLIASVALASAMAVLWALNPFSVQPLAFVLLIGLAAVVGLLWWLRPVMAAPALAPQGRLLLALGAATGMIPAYTGLRYGFTQWFNWLPVALLALCLLTSALPRRIFPWMLGLISLLVVVYGAASYHNIFASDYADDFTALFRGPRSFLKGSDLYDIEAITANHLGNSFKYPPLFVLIMGPLTPLDYVSAIQLWRALNLLLLAASGVLLWLAGGRPLRSWTTLALGFMLLVMQPLRDTLRYGQVDLIMLIWISGAYLAIRRQRWSWWGICLAFPIAIKLYPALLLIHGVILRRWRGLAAALATLLALGAVAVASLGWAVHATYLTDVLPSIGGGTAWVENQTLNGWMNRLVATTIALTGDQAAAIPLLTYAGALLFGAATLLRSRRCTPATGFCLWIITMLIVLPISWIHYQALLIIPFFHLANVLDREAVAMSPRWGSIYALAWMLLVFGNHWTFYNRAWHGPFWALILSYKLYGLLLLWFAFAFDPRLQAMPAANMAATRRYPGALGQPT